MARKKAGKGRAGGEDRSDDESVVSSQATGREDMDGEEDEFAEALDWTFESRGSTREKECWQNQATIIGRCQAALKKGSAEEATLAATVLGLHVLTLGEPDDSGFQALGPDLLRAAKHGKTPAARAAAADALAVCCFVMADEGGATLDTLRGLQSLWARRDCAAAVRAAALRGWAFLFTTLSRLPAAGEIDLLLPALAALLHEGDVDLRAAAGEAIALVYHTCGLDELEAVLEEEEEEAEEGGEEGGSEEGGRGAAAPSGSSSGGGAPSGLSEVVGRMQELAVNRGDKLRRSRRDRSALRGAFRDITRIIEGGGVRETRIRLRHGDSLTINTLAGSVSIGYLRRFLAGGFQAHLQSNPLLHAVFDYQPLAERPGRLTALEKRQLRSPSSAASKQRAQDRRGQRSHKGGWGGED